jgi:putative transposase
MIQTISIELTDREKRLLLHLSNKRNISKQLSIRVLIIVRSFEQITYRQISKELGCSEPMIAKWKQRWSNNYAKLTAFSLGIDGKGVSDSDVTKEIQTILGDSPRSGSPVTFGLEVQAKIQALACEHPSKFGLPFTHWTNITLAQQVIAQQIVPSISSRHVARLLKKAT